MLDDFHELLSRTEEWDENWMQMHGGNKKMLCKVNTKNVLSKE